MHETNPLFDAVKNIVGEDHMRAEGQHLHVSPGGESELCQLAAAGRAHGATLIPVGKAGRSTPTDDLRRQLLLDMRRMNHIVHLDEVSLVVHVQAGLTGLELEKTLNKRGLTIGDFPPAALGSTIGGMLSVRTPGKSARRHGTFEDTVLGLSAVLSDGRLVHTRVAPRRASGPDLSRVLCGSEGALGVITSTHLRIHHQPETRILSAYRLPNFEEALTAVRLALREEASPAAIRIYDRAEGTAHLGTPGQGDEAIMVVACVGLTSLAACDRDLIASAIEAVGGHPTDESIAATWWRRRTGQSEIRHPPPRPNLQMSATPRMLAPVYYAVRHGADELKLRARAHASRFDMDGGVLFFTVTDQADVPLSQSAPEIAKLSAIAGDAGAYLLGQSDPALQRYLESLRNALDPGRHLNPGVLR